MVIFHGKMLVHQRVIAVISCHCDPCHVLRKASDLLPTGQASIGGGEWGPKRGLLCGLAPWQRASNAYGAEFENQPQRLVILLHKLDGNVLFFQLNLIELYTVLRSFPPFTISIPYWLTIISILKSFCRSLNHQNMSNLPSTAIEIISNHSKSL